MTLAQKIMNSPNNLPERHMANAIRALAMDAVEAAKSGHPGMPMGMADVATILFRNHLKFDVTNPTWADRDRFILSAGHGSMLIYALGYLCGYEKMTLDQIKNFRQMGALTAGHPEVMPEVGIEMTTGPLGQGVSTATGFALSERILNARFGDELVNHYTYVIASDGDLQEGISHESCSLAGHLKLNKLIVLWDDNGISIDGSTELSFTEDVLKRYEAYGWDTMRIDGHDFAQIDAAITKAKTNLKPTLIACKTTIGYGAPTKAGTSSSHGSPLGADEIKGAKAAYGWEHGPFEIPQDILNEWRGIGVANKGAREQWEQQLKSSDKRAEFEGAQNNDVSAQTKKAVADACNYFLTEKPKMATRATSGKVLEYLVAALPQLVGGSADLTGSNLTKVKGPAVIQASTNYQGQYVYYGVREHGMAAIMNGMALHGGTIPYGGTFMQFTDYCRPSIRLAALMKLRSIFVMTHDSIGLGEDGPTHQPVEHLAAMRAIPNLLVMRPCDGIETAECWQIALDNQTRPSVLVLSRQNLPTVRTNANENLCAKGAYVISPASSAPAKVVIMATGSEVEIALNAQKTLEANGTPTQVVSVPSFELFAAQDAAYKASVLGGAGTIRVGCEAAIRMGWDSLIGTDGIFIGMNGFGESAPADQLYKHFGITADAIVSAVQAKL
jgi:transketolase